MKKLEKALSIVMVVLMLACICTNVFATIDPTQITPKEDLGEADVTMTSIGQTILGIVTNVGMILAIILVAVLGIKYMMGSTEEKAEYKKSMIPYLVGAILVFGASAIGKAVIGFGQSMVQ